MTRSLAPFEIEGHALTHHHHLMTAAVRFRQSDVTRTVKGLVDAGLQVARIEICPKTGRIIAYTGEPEPTNDNGGPNEWDDVLQT